MRLGFVSDAHGNPLGLAACLAYFEKVQVEQGYFLGDACGYLPHGPEVLALLRSYGFLCLKGNHDAMLLGEVPIDERKAPVYRLEAARLQLTPFNRAWMASWPSSRHLMVDGLSFLLVHGSPWDPLHEYITPQSELARFGRLSEDIVLMGHTHRPFRLTQAGKTLINVGSCGLPRDCGHLASCVVYDTRTQTAELVRLPFDAARVVKEAGPIHASVAACLARDERAPLLDASERTIA